MAQYLVKLHNEIYMNRDLAKFRYDVGDAGLFALVADNVLRTEKVLDVCMYAKGCVDKYGDPHDIATYQDIDRVLDNLTEPDDEKIPYIMSDACTCYELRGYKIIPLNTVFEPNKYRALSKLPMFRFLGKQYIIVGACTKDSQFVVTLKKEA